MTGILASDVKKLREDARPLLQTGSSGFKEVKTKTIDTPTLPVQNFVWLGPRILSSRCRNKIEFDHPLTLNQNLSIQGRAVCMM